MNCRSNTLDSFQDTQSEKDKRIVKDRRQKPTKPISRYMFSGRRQSIRRQDWNSDIRIKYSQSAANESTEVLVSH